MSWFTSPTLDFSGIAKTALSQAQKSIDRVLDIRDDTKVTGINAKSNGGTTSSVQLSSQASSPSALKEGGEKPDSSQSHAKDDGILKTQKEHLRLPSKVSRKLKLDNEEFFDTYLTDHKDDAQNSPGKTIIPKVNSREDVTSSVDAITQHTLGTNALNASKVVNLPLHEKPNAQVVFSGVSVDAHVNLNGKTVFSLEKDINYPVENVTEVVKTSNPSDKDPNEGLARTDSKDSSEDSEVTRPCNETLTIPTSDSTSESDNGATISPVELNIYEKEKHEHVVNSNLKENTAKTYDLKIVGDEESSSSDLLSKTTSIDSSSFSEDVDVINIDGNEVIKDMELPLSDTGEDVKDAGSNVTSDTENQTLISEVQDESVISNENFIVDSSKDPHCGTNNCENKKENHSPDPSEQELEKGFNVTESEDGSKGQSNNDTVVLRKEVERLQELVSIRENKVITLSKENIDLQEKASILESQLYQLENLKQLDESEVDEMRKEFMKTIHDGDQKLRAVTKERNKLKDLLEETELKLTARLTEQEEIYSNALKEKEQQIKDLLDEGEKLSKKELQSNTAMKKLKSKLKEKEDQVKEHKVKEEEFFKREKDLENSLTQSNDNEKKLKDKVQELEILTDSQEDEIMKLKDKADDVEEQLKGTQKCLDNAYRELQQASIEKAHQISEAQETAIQETAKEKESIKKTLQETTRKWELEKQQLQSQVEDLQSTINRMSQNMLRKEEKFKVEIDEGLQKLQDAESRNQELSQGISAATRPLLRQIESLQRSLSSQAENWERVERNHTDTVAALQQQLALVSEKERIAVLSSTDMKARISALEKSVLKLKEEKDTLTLHLKEKEENCSIIEDSWQREKDKATQITDALRRSVQNLQNDKIFLEQQLASEKARVEEEISKLSLNMYNVSDNGNQKNSDVIIREDHQLIEPDVIASHPHPVTRSRSSSNSSSPLSDLLVKGTPTAVFERLQTQLRQKEGEVRILQEEIESLERTRSSLGEELLNMTNQVAELELECQEVEMLRSSNKELQERYAVTLQMYGEKAEEAEELRMDLEDVKLMYKQQIQDLFSSR